MTKNELLEAIKDMPGECEITYWSNGKTVEVNGVDCDGVMIYLEESDLFAVMEGKDEGE